MVRSTRDHHYSSVSSHWDIMWVCTWSPPPLPIPYLWYNGLVCLTCDVRVVGSPQQYAQCDEISTGSSHRCRPSIRDHLHTVISSLVPLVIGISSLVRTSSAAPYHQLGLQAQCYNFTHGPRTYIQLNSAAYQPMTESLLGNGHECKKKMHGRGP